MIRGLRQETTMSESYECFKVDVADFIATVRLGASAR